MNYRLWAYIVIFASALSVACGVWSGLYFHDASGTSVAHSGAFATLLSVAFLFLRYGSRLLEHETKVLDAARVFIGSTRAGEQEARAALVEVEQRVHPKISKEENHITKMYVIATLLGTFVWGFGDLAYRIALVPCSAESGWEKFWHISLSLGAWICRT